MYDTQQETLWILEQHGAILRGHFVGTSGRHLDTYVNKDAIYPHIGAVSRLCYCIAETFDKLRAEVVAAPAIGGAILSQWVAYHLKTLTGNPVLAVFAEKNDVGCFAFRRGYDRLIAGKRVLVVEDILTTGGSLRSVVNAVGVAGGTVAGVAALVNCGGVSAADIFPDGIGPPFVTLASLDLASWDEADCPLCKAGVPVNTEVGKGREFLEKTKGNGHNRP